MSEQSTTGVVVNGKPVTYTRSMMNQLVQKPKNMLLLLAALAGISVLVALVTNNNKDVTAISPIVANAAITDSGFTPSTIQVDPGQQITWTNDSSTTRHLAADPNMLAGFDIELAPTSTYTYTFEKSGTYYYYDSSNTAVYTGTVIVR